MTDFIPGKLYVVSTWAVDENIKNAFQDKPELEPSLFVWRKTAKSGEKFVGLPPGSIILWLGDFATDESGFGEFLHEDDTYVVDVTPRLHDWLVPADRMLIRHFRVRFKGYLDREGLS